MKKNKIVLAYSGGLDTSVAIKWLQEKYGYTVIALVANVGEEKNLQIIEDKALALGVEKCFVLDVQDEFAEQYLAKALQANALYEGVYPLISALSRPLIAKKLVEIAHQEGASAVAHGCTGKGNDQVRFDVSINILDPALDIIAPVRENPMSREEAIAYAQAHNIPLPINLDNPFSIDMNVWGRSCECGVLEDPWIEPPENAYALTTAVAECPAEATIIEIGFNAGLPVSLNGEKGSMAAIIRRLNEWAGAQGVGRIDHVENRLVGIKTREIYEAPAAITLIQAHQALEALCLTRDELHYKSFIEQKFTQLVYDGLWFSPLFKALNAFIKETQKTVQGTVRMSLFKGQARVIGRQSNTSLYQERLATYQGHDAFDHAAAKGFITIHGLASVVHATVNKGGLA